jgi:Na+/H+ antiporter NhaD/arsenite permease-like protein
MAAWRSGAFPASGSIAPASPSSAARRMIVFGGVSLDEAFHAIDWDTIALPLGMMIVVAHLKVSGAFRGLGALAVEHAHAPTAPLIATTLLAGLLSAFLVNDAICLVMAPIVVRATRALGRNPLPYLVATATVSNCGSVATITGNPQNMVIGALSGISYSCFSATLAPVAAFSLAMVVVVVRLVYRAEFAERTALDPHVLRGRVHPGQMLKASLTCVALAIAFFAGVRSLKPARIYRELDGPLLILFAGLFVVVSGAERALLTPDIVASVHAMGLADPWRLSALVAVLSNIVSKVPAVLALKPFIPPLADAHRAWLVVAMSSTLAGNFTLLGSVANLIVAEQARAEGTPIGFLAYFKVGLPLTLVTLAFGTAWLAWSP